MAFPQTNQMMHAMSIDMQRKLGHYYTSMESRYGDPRVQQEQLNEQRRAQAAAMHAKAQETSALLQDAYAQKQAKNRTEHGARIASKSRAPKTATRPASEPAPPRAGRTRAPAAASAAAPSPDPASQGEGPPR